MLKKAATILLFLPVLLQAQNVTVVPAGTVVDTAGIYSERKDTLQTSVVSGGGQGNYLSKFKDVRTEVISASGLCKMACCNLAESFENSASVSVGYSDAVTGARQIRLLGLSGVFTQMLDENRPVMRGLASPFGLSYVPGQWLSSIQIAKGASSVINGVESISGQINMEHRKPTDEIPFFLNASFMSNLMADLNLASSLQINEKWSTVLLGHVSGNFKTFDMNGDGFMDEPSQLQVNLANRWLYYAPNGTQLRFGLRFLRDTRTGGQEGYAREDPECTQWGSRIVNQSVNAYFKAGFPLNEDNTRNFAVVADFNDYMMNGGFGKSGYDASQTSGFLNLLYQDQYFENHHFTVGLSTLYDHYNEMFTRKVAEQGWKNEVPYTDLVNLGLFGEYTFHYGDKISVIAGVRGDWYNREGVRFSPRLNVRYTPIKEIVLRANFGRGLRNANSLTDRIGVMSTGKAFLSDGTMPSQGDNPNFMSHSLEDAWIAGGNITFYLPFGASDNTYIGFDYFNTSFARQLIADYERFTDRIDFYFSDKKSYTNTYQIDFAVEPIKRFTIALTFRYTDSRTTYANRGLLETPMVSKYKGVLNLQYATNLSKWIFDFTASLNGPCRLYDFMGGGYSEVYPLLYLQVTHRMKGWDLYIGGENLTNYTQKNPIINAENPSSPSFDASCIWGPLMGIKAYIGVRITLWKKS